MKILLKQYFNSWWIPTVVYICFLGGFNISASVSWKPLTFIASILLSVAAIAFLGLAVTSLWNLIKKRWGVAIINLIFLLSCGVATVYTLGFLIFSSMFVPSEDGYTDNHTIHEGIEIADPDQDATTSWGANAANRIDGFQINIRKALSVPGDNITEFMPAMPSLRRASTEYPKAFRDYLEAHPDWHVFIENGNRFAIRRWSYGGEPRDTLNGYISEFGGSSRFQTRCIISLDRKQLSKYSVQLAQEGGKLVKPEMSKNNELHESRIMIESGKVWVEIFEQSDNLERRVSKATVTNLENEFSVFLKNPKNAVATARTKSREWANRLAGEDNHPFRLLSKVMPGIYEVVYSLNLGESGSVYLKAFEVTQETPLSVEMLKTKSRTRMTWSDDPLERFGAKAGFTVYESDWGKHYAARFEVWFKQDSSKTERKIAERIFKIKGWQR